MGTLPSSHHRPVLIGGRLQAGCPKHLDDHGQALQVEAGSARKGDPNPLLQVQETPLPAFWRQPLRAAPPELGRAGLFLSTGETCKDWRRTRAGGRGLPWVGASVSKWLPTGRGPLEVRDGAEFNSVPRNF